MTHHPPSRARIPAALTIASLAVAGLGAPLAAHAAVSPDAPVVIAEVYGGGGNSGAPYNRDFIELQNTSGHAVDLSGWSVQYAAAGGASWQVTPLGARSLPAGARLLVGEALGANTALPSFAPDVDGTIALSGTQGKVALVDATTALSGASGVPAQPHVIDFVGWGAASDAAGSPAPATTNATSVARTATGANTSDNAADFTVGAPTPMGGASTDPGTDPGPAEPLTIAQIQGTDDTSPYVGKAVLTRGVVTASYPTGGLDGFVVQTAGSGGPQATARTASDAVFVYATGASSARLGAYVEVTGTVTEYHGLTEIASTSVTPIDERVDAPVPTPLAWPRTDAEREAFESMLVTPSGPFTVTDTHTTNQYGEVGLASGTEPLRQPTDVARPGTTAAADVRADNAARAITLDDGASTNFLSAANSSLTPAYVSLAEPVRVGASVTFTQPLIVDWRNDVWKLNPTQPLVGDGSGAGDGVDFENTRTAAPASVGGAVSVASFNVLNYFTTLGDSDPSCTSYTDRTGDGLTVRGGCPLRGAWDAGDLARQQAKIVAAINRLDASVVGLLEVENSAVLGEPKDEALGTLVAALNDAAGSQKWSFVPSSSELPPLSQQDVITAAIIYQPAAVTPVGAERALGTQSAAGQAFANARPPLAQVFRPAAGGEKFLFSITHLKSKGSAGPWPGDADAGDGQGASNESRVRQATALRDWIEQIRGGITTVALAGDFNSYSAEDPLQVLYDAGYVDAEHALGIDRSSYSFDGLSGSLDHILLSRDARQRATGGDIWSINSGESVALEYSRYNVSGTLFYAPDPYRSSDHDPVKVGFAAGTDERPLAAVALAATSKVSVNGAHPASLTASVTLPGGAPADGTVEFREGSVVVGSATVVDGVATLTLGDIARGDHAYLATFAPADPDSVRGAASAPVTLRGVRR